MSTNIKCEMPMNGAVAFKYACDILIKKMNLGIANKAGLLSGFAALDGSLFIPIMVNGALACELYMKSLIYMDHAIEEKIKEHRLEYLFSQLQSSVQLSIKSKTVENIVKKGEKNYTDEEFDSDLRKHTNVFIDWRYFYEHKECSSSMLFITCFLDALHKLAYEKYKEDTTP